MENASRALLMAAGILVGLIIISIAVYLFTTYGQYSKETYEKMSDTQIDQFNSQFLKYEGLSCSAHDVVSIVNLAQQNNIEYELQEQTAYSDNTFYVQVDIEKKQKNLEKKWSTEVEKITFLKKGSEYTCKEIHISSVTKRVNYIVFAEK